jgi:hydrogenase/urease accessory protein HupE
LLVFIALALFAGQRSSQAARCSSRCQSRGWPVESSELECPGSALPTFTTLTFALAGALVAFNAQLRPVGVATLSIAAAAVHGYVNGATMMRGGADALALAGAVTAVFCVLAILSAQGSVLPAGWTRIAVRVAGSWAAAAGILMLGWLARPFG